MAKSNEPIWWSLFGAGGMLAALLLPVTIVLTGIAVPAGWLSEERLWDLVCHPLGRVYLFAVISPPLFHWAHRFRFVLVDLGLKGADRLLAVLFYGVAIAASVASIVLLVRL